MALLKLKADEIIDIEVVDPFELGDTDSEKEGILDIKIHLNSNQKINLEMQNRYQEDWSERTLFYNCRMFVEGYEYGTTYGDMEPCIHVGILNYIQMKSQGFHHKIMLLDEETGEVYSSEFVFHVIELKKLEETPKIDRNELHQWARLIAANTWEEVCAEADGNPYMEEVKEEMQKISRDEKERYLYLREAMALSDEASRMRTARREGIREGLKVSIKMFQECGFSKDEVVKKLIDNCDISKGEIEELLEKYWK